MDFLRTLKRRQPKQRARVSSARGRSKPNGIDIVRKYLRKKVGRKK